MNLLQVLEIGILSMMKNVVYELFQLLTDAFMHFPFASIRLLWAKIVCKHVGKGTQFCRHVHLISPHRISFGENVFVNRNATLDGRRNLMIEDNVDIGEYASVWSLQHDTDDENHKCIGGYYYKKSLLDSSSQHYLAWGDR